MRRIKNRRCLWLPLLCLCLAAGGCQQDNFASLPPFEQLRNSLSSVPPTADERQLLRKFQPQLYIAASAEPPLDFYADYIAQGELRVNGETVAAPTRADLNAHKYNLQARFTHHPADAPTTPVAYGGVSYAELELPELGKRRFTFLSYHFVFRASGLPAGVDKSLWALAGLFADPEDWHQLDHYTAAYIVLDDETPVAVMLQQHNYMRTYLFDGEFFTGDLPLRLAAAISSNELYPYRSEKTAWRTVGFMSPSSADYLLALRDSNSALETSDITDATRQVAYQLQFLPPDDAFYVFTGWLGELRLLPGRDGPPGALYRSYPQLCDLAVALPVFYWNEGDTDYMDIMRAATENFANAKGHDYRLFSDANLDRLRERFARALRQTYPDIYRSSRDASLRLPKASDIEKSKRLQDPPADSV